MGVSFRNVKWSILFATVALVPLGAISAAPVLSARMAQASVLKSDGTIATWGSNADGQLGNGRTIIVPTPGQLKELPEIVQVASSNEHVVALDAKGRVWTWGATNYGRLGSRAQRNPALPGRVQGVKDAVAVAATDYASFALKSDGTVWMWGGALYGWTTVSPEPRQLTQLVGIAQIAGGGDHLVMRTVNGTVVTLGANTQGQAGDGTVSSANGPRTPVVVAGLSNVTWVAAGGNSSMAVTATGQVFAWGQVHWEIAPNSTPQMVEGFARPVTRVAGRSLHFALLDDGTVWQFGSAVPGSGIQAPVKVAGLADITEIAVPALFDAAVFAKDSAGALFAYSRNSYGEFGTGVAGEVPPVVTKVPLGTAVKTMAVGRFGVVAVTADGKTWTWGRNGLGALGRGDLSIFPTPVTVSGLANATRVSVGMDNMVALDNAGDVWAWGANYHHQYGNNGRTPSSVPVKVPISGVRDLAAGWSAVIYLKNDGTVWISGLLTGASFPAPTRLGGIPVVDRIAAGSGNAFLVTASGDLWAVGDNSFGQLGDGTFTNRSTPVRIEGLPPILQVSSDFDYTMALSTSGEVWVWGNNFHGIFGNGQSGDLSGKNPMPQKIAGLSGVAEIAAGRFHALARLSDGTVKSWGGFSPAALGRSSGTFDGYFRPDVVDGLDSVVSVAAGDGVSYALRADGSVWGWGGVVCPHEVCPTTGDGTLVQRDRPVVVIREGGKGNLDTNDWFLDAKPGTPKTIPAAKVPKAVAFANAFSSSGLLNVDATVNVRASDQSKNLGVYVVGLVPAAFLKQVPLAAGAHAKVAGLKADQQVLVNLTPSGWTVASGQLQALQSGTGNAFLGAAGLLVNVNPATIPGARFCIGYGESASDMLKTGTIRDFLALEGAASSSLGLPCLLSGVYMEGPHTSRQGSAVPIRAVVVGQGPTGALRFRENFREISADVAIQSVNAAVSDATFSYTAPAAGEYAFTAAYGGDVANAAAISEIPLRHVVRQAQSATTVKIDAPVTSEIGAEVRLTAQVDGSNPGGTVQFKRGGADEGAPVPVIDDQAVITVVGLAIGEHGFTAAYSGDAANQASTSVAFAHKVLDVATSAASLASSANPAPFGSPVTLTATVTGANPTGTVTLREGATVVESKSLVSGSATFTLVGLGAGMRVLSVDYAGDANNPAATSNAVFQQVSLGTAFEVNVRTLVTGYYEKILRREPDSAGLDFWAAEARRLATLGADVREVFYAMSIAFFSSPEYVGRNTSDTQYVTDLYTSFFSRQPDAAGLAYWLGEFTAVGSRSALLNGFLFSTEFAGQMNGLFGATASRPEVTMTIDLFRGVFGRLPDSAGFSYWLGQLRQAQCQGAGAVSGKVNEVAGLFFNSSEYLARSRSDRDFAGDVYNAYMRRGPGGDSAGFNYWVSQVPVLGRDGVRAQFVPSAEFQGRVTAVVNAGCVQ